MSESDIFITIKPLITVFSGLGISYYIGGSVASSAFGKARSTLDVDIIAKISIAEVKPLVDGLKDIFYISETAILDAIRNSASFNIIHLETMLKVDIFILKKREYDQQAFARKLEDHIDEENPESTFFIASPEDTILNKLEWYLAGGEVSERQWGDVIGVLKVQADKLNLGYMRLWAEKLRVGPLLEKALSEAF
jgi:hypothetical protein